jgi:hypothetical protein
MYAFSGRILNLLRFLLDNIFITDGYCDLVQNHAFLVKNRRHKAQGIRLKVYELKGSDLDM